MKRIILTESQYKRLVRQPLNEEKDKGGKLIFDTGYGFDDLTDNMVLLLNNLIRVLKVRYKKNVYIKKVKKHVLTIDLSKYSKKQVKTIKYVVDRYFNGSEFLGDYYNSDDGEMVFEPEEIEDITIDEPEEIEDITIDEPEEIEDEPEDSDGVCESGDCENGEGVYRYENRDVFDGLFKDGELDNGVYTYENGDVYEGVFENDVFNGEGTFIDKETGRMDYGMWEDGELNGEVIITYENLDVYEGNWENDTMNGYGEYLYENGSEYEGEWKDGKLNGEGVYIDDDGVKFEGTFEDNDIKDGILTYPDGREIKYENGEVVSDEGDDDTNDDTEIEIIPGCECCGEENVNFYQDNITNLKESNNFRWWVHQDEDRLKKVNDKLEECGYDDGLNISYNVYGNESPHMIISFGEVGQEWVDDGKPEKPEDEEEDDIVEGNCELTEEEQTLFDSKITNFKTANNFRWWIHQDKDRLEKVEKKLKSCGLSPELGIVCKWTVGIDKPIGSTFFENQYMDTYGDYLKIPFKLYGSDWVNSGSVRPKATYKNSNGNLSNDDLVAIQDDVNNNPEYLHKNAVDSWNKMIASAANDGTDITISDAYRTCGEPGDYERFLNKEVRFTQWAAWRHWNKKTGKAAAIKPTSEEKWLKDGGGYCTSHHGFKGAVDISNGKGWMRENAPKFGWCKYIGERWHWDYYGDDIDDHLANDKVHCK